MRLCRGSNTFSRLATLGIALHRRGEGLPAGGSSGADGAVARLHAMPSKDRATYDPPEKSGGEGWLVSAEQQLLCQFKPDAATAHAQWVPCAPTAGFRPVHQCRKPVGGCSGTTRSKPGRRCSRRVGGVAARLCGEISPAHQVVIAPSKNWMQGLLRHD